jgi:hypothetical protein
MGEFSVRQASYFVACLAHGLRYIFDCIRSPYALIYEGLNREKYLVTISLVWIVEIDLAKLRHGL